MHLYTDEMCVADSADEVSSMMYDVPNDADDDDGMKDQLTVECSHRPFPSVYHLQLDSHTK